MTLLLRKMNLERIKSKNNNLMTIAKVPR